MNYFNKQFKQSISQEDKSWWEKFFKKPIDWDVDLKQEYDGIDAKIAGYNIQLKLREKYYEDILIEFAHSNGEKGWINKKQKCNFLIYGWRNKDFIYIFEWNLIVEFWKNNNVFLFKKYGKNNIQAAQNENKITYNFSIPFSDLNVKYKIIKYGRE